MTAVIAIENKNLNDIVIIGDEVLKMYGSNIYIEPGEEITLRDLLYVLRKDKKRYYRIKNLIHFYELAKNVKKKNDPIQFQ